MDLEESSESAGDDGRDTTQLLYRREERDLALHFRHWDVLMRCQWTETSGIRIVFIPCNRRSTAHIKHAIQGNKQEHGRVGQLGTGGPGSALWSGTEVIFHCMGTTGSSSSRATDRRTR